MQLQSLTPHSKKDQNYFNLTELKLGNPPYSGKNFAQKLYPACYYLFVQSWGYSHDYSCGAWSQFQFSFKFAISINTFNFVEYSFGRSTTNTRYCIIYFLNNCKYSRTLQKCLTSVRALKKDPHPDKEDYRLCPVESHLHQDKEEFSLSQTKEHSLQCPT